MYDEKFMRRAIEISAQALEKAGTHPYGAVVVKDGRIVGEGLNQSTRNFDPTSHGEVEAIRDACRNLKTLDLSGCEIYASTEPCSICVSTMMVSRISHLYYGASIDQADSVSPWPAGTPQSTFVRAQVALPPEEREMPAEQKLDGEAVAVLEAFIRKFRA